MTSGDGLKEALWAEPRATYGAGDPAIFFSSIVLAVVILYGITKDRWRWRGHSQTSSRQMFLCALSRTRHGQSAWGNLKLLATKKLKSQQKVEHQKIAYAGLMRLGMKTQQTS